MLDSLNPAALETIWIKYAVLRDKNVVSAYYPLTLWANIDIFSYFSPEYIILHFIQIDISLKERICMKAKCYFLNKQKKMIK